MRINDVISTLLVTLLLLCYSTKAQAENHSGLKKLENKAASPNSQHVTPIAEFKIYRHNNRIFFPATLEDGRRKMVLFDSGATTSVFFEGKDTLNEESEGAVPVYFPAMGIETYGIPYPNLNLSFGGITLPAHTGITASERLKLEIEPEMDFQGLVGQHLLHAFQVEINMADRVMRLWPKDADISHLFETSRHLTTDQGRPVVHLKAKLPWTRKKKHRFMMDSGYPGSLVIWHTNAFKRKIETLLVRPDSTATYAMIMDLGFSGTRLRRAPVFVLPRRSPTETQDGIIGMAFLSLLHVAFDFERDRLLINRLKNRTYDRSRAIELLAFAPTLRDPVLLELTPQILECIHRRCLSIVQNAHVSRFQNFKSSN